MSNFRPIDRATLCLLPPSVDEWLPDDQLARIVFEIVEQLDLSGMERAYRGASKASYHPAMLTALLLCGYATGRRSAGASSPPDCPQADSALCAVVRPDAPPLDDAAGGGRADDPPPAHSTGMLLIRATQTDRRTGVRHHQVGDPLPSIPVAIGRKVGDDRNLGTMAWNIQRMAVLVG